jgi:replicative DNA helicase
LTDIRHLPEDLDAERAVLGAMILNPECIFRVLQYVTEADFFKESNRAIFKAVVALNEKGKKIDPITISHEMKQSGEDPKPALKIIDDKTLTSALAEQHAEIVREKSIARKGIRELTYRTQELYDGENPERVMNDVFNFTTTDFGNKAHDFECDLNDLLSRVADKVQKATDGQRRATIPSGLASFDGKFGGWEVGALTVLLAPPKVGKSQLMMNSCNWITKVKIKAGYILLDMMRDKIIFRFVSSRLQKTVRQIENGEVAFGKVGECLDQIREQGKGSVLKIAGQENIGHDHKACIRWMMYANKNFGTQIFFVDSFQKFEVKPEKGQTDESFISQMINDFQTCAQKLDVAIVGTVDMSYEGKAKGSSRWGYGVDSVFELVYKEEENFLLVKSKFLRNGRGGEIKLSTNYDFSEITDYKPRTNKAFDP